MGWSIGYSKKHNRFIGYGVPAPCDHPGCATLIDRGLGYVCCDMPDHEKSCQAYFCEEHRENYVYPDEIEDMNQDELSQLGLDADEDYSDCDGPICCRHTFEPHKESIQMVEFILTDESWQKWRDAYPTETANLKRVFDEKGDKPYLIVGPNNTPD